jgi:hypothetical protein
MNGPAATVRVRLLTATLAVLAVLAGPRPPAVAQTAAVLARDEFLAGQYPFTQQDPPVFVNEAVGAGIFYNSGLFGSRTVIGNVEAGAIWGGHEVFDRSALGLGPAVSRLVSGSGATGEYDFHATMVGHVLAGTGYVAATGSTAAGLSYAGMGMAPYARLWSGAIATSFSADTASIGSFSSTPASTIPVYRQFFQGISGTRPDVINSSFGFDDPTAMEVESVAIDALAAANPTATFVAAAGNESTSPVASPGNVYNGITVGSVGGTDFLTPSSFSSHGAVDFYNPQTHATVAGVRAAVDVSAPGEQDFLAAYLGPTGGLKPLTNVTQNPSPTDRYFVNQDGTSFASPTVAGGVALMKDAAKAFGMTATALDSRVVRAVFMATAAKTDGWNNGQTTVGGVVRTTQSLDYATGAGALDLTTAGLTYVQGATIDVSGSGGGTIGSSGWDLAAVAVGSTTDYRFSATLDTPMELQVALGWFTGGVFDAASNTGSRTAFANLDLQVWQIVNGSFGTLVAESSSIYNNAEMLRLTLPQGGLYGLRVALPQMVYDIGSTPVASETYGLSWKMVAVPEPSAAVLAATGAVLAAAVIRRRLGRPPVTSGAALTSPTRRG